MSVVQTKLCNPRDWHVIDLNRDINAGDTAMVWSNNKVTGRSGWTGPGVVVAVSPTRTFFWTSMRGCLLKCLSEKCTRRPTRNGSAPSEVELWQRNCSTAAREVESVGTMMWNPRADTRLDIRQVLGSAAPLPGPTRFAVVRQAVETGLRRDHVNPKTDQAVSQVTETSDHVWGLSRTSIEWMVTRNDNHPRPPKEMFCKVLREPPRPSRGGAA